MNNLSITECSVSMNGANPPNYSTVCTLNLNQEGFVWAPDNDATFLASADNNQLHLRLDITSGDAIQPLEYQQNLTIPEEFSGPVFLEFFFDGQLVEGGGDPVLHLENGIPVAHRPGPQNLPVGLEKKLSPRF